MKLVYAKNPVWSNRSQTLIDLTVRFEEIDEDLPFTANPNDTEDHCRDIYARAVAGEFGSILPFNKPAPTVDFVSELVRSERNQRLADTDWTQALDVPQETKDKWSEYRQALRNFPQQEGFPWYDIVVQEDDFGYAVDISKALWPTKP